MFFRPMIALLVLLVSSGLAFAADVRKTFDTAGRLLQQQTFDGEVLLEQIDLAYDSAGRLTEKRTRHGGATSREVIAYLSSGRIGREEFWTGDELLSRKLYLYREGRVASMTVETRGREPSTTTWTYDAYGRERLVEVQDAAGRVISTEASSYPPPAVPVDIEFEGGGTYQSDIRVLDLEAGLTISRNPHSTDAGRDPLEISGSASYRLGDSKDGVENNQLRARYDMNYLLSPRLELFLSTNFQSNPVVNLRGDVELAPIGVKLVGSPLPAAILHLNVAPVWHFRSIRSPTLAGEPCGGVVVSEETDCQIITSKARVSLGGLASFEGDLGSVTLQAEFLPELAPENGDVIGSLRTDAIFRAALLFELKLSERFSLKEELFYTHDETLGLQVDCGLAANARMCAGHSFLTSTILSFKLTGGD